MANELTPKQEKYAQLLGTSTITQSDAYRQAYDCENMDDKTIWEAASRLAADSKVIARIEELKAESKRHLKYDAEAHFRKLEKLEALALTPMGKDGDIKVGDAIKAVVEQGKLVGLYTEKTDVVHHGAINVEIVTGGTLVKNPVAQDNA